MENLKSLKVGLAQISPIWLNKHATTEKIISYIDQAGNENCDLVVFGEAILPGYPFWLSFTNGSEFESLVQKQIHAHYLKNAVNIENGDLDAICRKAKENKTAVYLGTIENATNRGGHSLYCTLVYIDKQGDIQSSHRKLQPTYEERLSWSPGDGHGLTVHPMGNFKLGGLNCWENWMPLSRSALYAQGENVHVAVWPGSVRNTIELNKFIAKESRSYVISVNGLLKKEDIPKDLPHYDMIYNSAPEIMADGGSCVTAPDGTWVIEPIAHKEGLFTAELDIDKIYEERQNFDPSGHYSRPDVIKLSLDKRRQSVIDIKS